MIKLALIVSDMGAGFRPSSYDYESSTIAAVESLLARPKNLTEEFAKQAKMKELELPEVVKFAQEILTYAQNLETRGNDYLVKVKALANQECIEWKFASTLISIIKGYIKHMKIEFAKKSSDDVWNNEIVASEGEVVQGLNAVVNSAPRTHSTRFGTSWIYNFQDEASHVLTWFSSNDKGFGLGDKVVIEKATSKGGNVYQGKTSTMITGAKVSSIA